MRWVDVPWNSCCRVVVLVKCSLRWAEETLARTSPPRCWPPATQTQTHATLVVHNTPDVATSLTLTYLNNIYHILIVLQAYPTGPATHQFLLSFSPTFPPYSRLKVLPPLSISLPQSVVSNETGSHPFPPVPASPQPTEWGCHSYSQQCLLTPASLPVYPQGHKCRNLSEIWTTKVHQKSWHCRSNICESLDRSASSIGFTTFQEIFSGGRLTVVFFMLITLLLWSYK